MTPLDKPVSRKSYAIVRDRGVLRELVVTLYPTGVLGLRPAKTRQEERVTLEACFSLAIKQRVAKEHAEKLSKKKKKGFK